jgi:hypothetical protein
MAFTYIVVEVVASIGGRSCGWSPLSKWNHGPKSTSTVLEALETLEEVVDRLCDGESHYGHYGFHVGQGVRIRTYVFEGGPDDDYYWTKLGEARQTTDFEI